jgi:hypothetical protein
VRAKRNGCVVWVSGQGGGTLRVRMML